MLRRFSLLAVALAGIAALAFAQDESVPPNAAGDQAADTARQPPKRSAGDENRDLPNPAPEDDEFIPTEEIPADEEVTFPVDI
jgi:hypothetical protein